MLDLSSIVESRRINVFAHCEARVSVRVDKTGGYLEWKDGDATITVFISPEQCERIASAREEYLAEEGCESCQE